MKPRNKHQLTKADSIKAVISAINNGYSFNQLEKSCKTLNSENYNIEITYNNTKTTLLAYTAKAICLQPNNKVNLEKFFNFLIDKEGINPIVNICGAGSDKIYEEQPLLYFMIVHFHIFPTEAFTKVLAKTVAKNDKYLDSATGGEPKQSLLNNLCSMFNSSSATNEQHMRKIEELIKLFIKSGASHKVHSGTCKLTPLMMILVEGKGVRVEFIEEFIRLAQFTAEDLNAKEITGQTAAHLAALRQNDEAFSLLRRLGADIGTIKDNALRTPLEYWKNFHPNAIKPQTLQEEFFNIIETASQDFRQLIKLIASPDVDINQASPSFSLTALEFLFSFLQRLDNQSQDIIKTIFEKIVLLLDSKKFDPHKKSRRFRNQNILHLAVNAIDDIGIITKILPYIDPHESDGFKMTPFEGAIARKKWPIIKLFVDLYPKCSAKYSNIQWNTIELETLSTISVENLEYLIQKGFLKNPHLTLIHAAILGKVVVFQLLQGKYQQLLKTDLSLSNTLLETVLNRGLKIAIIHHRHELVNYLLHHGVSANAQISIELRATEAAAPYKNTARPAPPSMLEVAIGSENYAAIPLLLDFNANPIIQDINYTLKLIVENNLYELLKHLISQKIISEIPANYLYEAMINYLTPDSPLHPFLHNFRGKTEAEEVIKMLAYNVPLQDLEIITSSIPEQIQLSSWNLCCMSRCSEKDKKKIPNRTIYLIVSEEYQDEGISVVYRNPTTKAVITEDAAKITGLVEILEQLGLTSTIITMLSTDEALQTLIQVYIKIYIAPDDEPTIICSNETKTHFRNILLPILLIRRKECLQANPPALLSSSDQNHDSSSSSNSPSSSSILSGHSYLTQSNLKKYLKKRSKLSLPAIRRITHFDTAAPQKVFYWCHKTICSNNKKSVLKVELHENYFLILPKHFLIAQGCSESTLEMVPSRRIKFSNNLRLLDNDKNQITSKKFDAVVNGKKYPNVAITHELDIPEDKHQRFFLFEIKAEQGNATLLVGAIVADALHSNGSVQSLLAKIRSLAAMGVSIDTFEDDDDNNSTYPSLSLDSKIFGL